MPTHPIVAIADLQLEGRPEAWQPPATARRRFDVKRARAAPLLGLKMLGCTLHVVSTIPTSASTRTRARSAPTPATSRT